MCTYYQGKLSSSMGSLFGDWLDPAIFNTWFGTKLTNIFPVFSSFFCEIKPHIITVSPCLKDSHIETMWLDMQNTCHSPDISGLFSDSLNLFNKLNLANFLPPFSMTLTSLVTTPDKLPLLISPITFCSFKTFLRIL